MMAFGAIAGISAGAIVSYRSYLDLNLAAAILGAVLVLGVLLTVVGKDRDGQSGQTPLASADQDSESGQTVFSVTPARSY